MRALNLNELNQISGGVEESAPAYIYLQLDMYVPREALPAVKYLVEKEGNMPTLVEVLNAIQISNVGLNETELAWIQVNY